MKITDLISEQGFLDQVQKQAEVDVLKKMLILLAKEVEALKKRFEQGDL